MFVRRSQTVYVISLDFFLFLYFFIHSYVNIKKVFYACIQA